ncbi:Uncharacterised protein [Proteus mirabilis]|uniref:Uncharacterized protein n=1 Tax=Proteus mirabilis TaxID=584 RepID=A0A2X2BW92_PROMI|nr:Uncharacterised protein [Proteus mirabilis]
MFSSSLYRWFLRYFPHGGTYRAIHNELIKQRQTQWIESLIQYIYLRHFSQSSFAKQEQEVIENILSLLGNEKTNRCDITTFTLSPTAI